MLKLVSNAKPGLVILTLTACALLTWAGLLGWLRYGPDMVLALAAGGLSLCF